MTAFGLTETVFLNKPLELGEVIFIELSRILQINSANEEIFIESMDIEKHYSLTTYMTDISISGYYEILNQKQFFILDVYNNSFVPTNAVLEIYRNGVLYKEINLFLDAESYEQITLCYEEFEKGDSLYFNLVSEVEDKYDYDNDISFIVEIGKIAESPNNPYGDTLKSAKRFMI